MKENLPYIFWMSFAFTIVWALFGFDVLSQASGLVACSLFMYLGYHDLPLIEDNE